MKSFSQILEQRTHRLARQKVRDCTQPAALVNIIENEMIAFISETLNQRLREEQEQLLQRTPYQRGGDGRRRNGYKPTSLKGLFQKLVLKRPVLRGKTPSSSILSTLRKVGQGLLALIASRFWLRGASTRAVAQEINTAFGTRLHSADISRFSETLLPDIEAWLKRPIQTPYAYLFLDALYLPVKRPGTTDKQALLCAVGLTDKGQKNVLGFLLGDRENIDAWESLINDLVHRGLDPKNLRLVISDEHKAILSAVENILNAPHQLCIVHKMRNALTRVSQKHRHEFYLDFKAIYWAQTKEDALRAVGKLEAKWQSAYPKAAAIACHNPEAFLRFFGEPEKSWSTLRSTNLIERFIRELRRRTRPAGAMHGENSLFKLAVSVAVEQEKRWAHRKYHSVKEQQLKLAA